MKVFARLLLLIPVVMVAACAHHRFVIYAPMQADGWSAQPISVESRFAPDADLDPATGTPTGDPGYNFYILTAAPDWNFGKASSLVLSIAKRPWLHSWIILESPDNRLECGLTGDSGISMACYYDGLYQRIRNGDPNPIAYLWHTLSDGRCEVVKPERSPTFVWRMPITRKRYQLIHDYLMHRDNTNFDIRSDNCTDLAAEAAKVAGINLIHRMRLTMPETVRFLFMRLRVWTDPQYRILEFSTPDVLEADLRNLVRFGIGFDATQWYFDLPDQEPTGIVYALLNPQGGTN